MNHFQRLNEVKELKIFFFAHAQREYTKAGMEQATVAMRCFCANSPEPRRPAARGARIGHVSAAHGRHVSAARRRPVLQSPPSQHTAD